MTTQPTETIQTITTTKQLRAELKRTGFKNVASVRLQSSGGTENHLRVSMTEIRYALIRADKWNNSRFFAMVSYRDGTRYIEIDGWQEAVQS